MTEDPQSFVDAAGRTHSPVVEEPRILSLAAPLTDLCVALDLAGAVVGRTADCDAGMGIAAASAVVGSPAAPDLDRVRDLAPTHALVHLAETPSAVVSALFELGIDVVAVRPRTPAENFELFKLVGGIFSVAPEADTLARRLEAALARIKMALHKEPLRRILYVGRIDPFRVVTPSSYAARMLELARFAVIGPGDAKDDIADFDPDDDTLRSVDAILFDGSNGTFRRADLRSFATARGIETAKLYLMEERVADWYGTRAIAAVDDLIDLRRRLERVRSES